jgi:alkyl hydroperoxide reductase subunit AhpC
MLLMLAVFFVIPAVSYALEVGDKAPLFDGESTEGTISLKSYFGEKHVVLAFYFADFTPV